jgi:hypothetical protein
LGDNETERIWKEPAVGKLMIKIPEFVWSVEVKNRSMFLPRIELN